jgi:hypothetical protein
MKLSILLRGIATSGVRVAHCISEEIKSESLSVRAGDKAPAGPSTSDLDEILDGDSSTAEVGDMLKYENERLNNMLVSAGDQARPERRFTFQDDDEGVDYSVTGSASSPDRTSRYQRVDLRIWKNSVKGPWIVRCAGT